MRRFVEISSLTSDRRGVAAVEYAILGAMLASAVLVGAGSLASSMTAAFGQMGMAQQGVSANVVDNQRPL